MIYDKNTAMHVLGSIYKNPSILNNSSDFPVFTHDFVPKTHQYFFGAMVNLYDSGAQEFSIQLISDYFDKYPELQEVMKKEKAYDFIMLSADIANPKNFSVFHDRLRKLSLLREVKAQGMEVKEWYEEDMAEISKRQKMEKKLEEATITEIIQSFKKRFTEIELQFEVKGDVEIVNLAIGLENFIESLDGPPEMGLALEADIFSTVILGARKTALYSVSGGTGVGKSRFAALQAISLAFPIRFNPFTSKWEPTGKNQVVGLINTELQTSLIQRMAIAFVSGVDEEKIKMRDFSAEEKKRIAIAIQIIEKYKDNFHIALLHDPRIVDINTIVRKMVFDFGIEYLFYDYIHTSPALLAEFNSQRIREDVILMMLSSALKNLANELDIMIWTGTQVNAQIDKQPFADENCLRGSRAIADKFDVGAIIKNVTPEEAKKVVTITRQICPNTPPNMALHLYKNREGGTRRVIIWIYADLGRGWFITKFMTDEEYTPIKVKVVKILRDELLGTTLADFINLDSALEAHTPAPKELASMFDL